MELTKDGRHRFKWMTYDGVKVRIDKDIAPLLSKMWKLGIRTTNSCHGHCSFTCKHKWTTKKDRKTGDEYSCPILTEHCHNSVWLAFESSSDVELLYNIVAEYATYEDRNAMYHKMSCDRFLQTGQTNFRGPRDGWAFSFLLRNYGVRGHWGRPIFNGKRSTQEMWIDDDCPRNEFIIQPQITFPRAHIQYVENKLDKAIKRKKK